MKQLLILIATLWAISTLSADCYSQKVELTGRVVAVERPEKMWPLHYSSVTLFYVKVEKVHKGAIKGNYVRLIYPSDRESFRVILEDILSPGSRWRFRGGVLEEFDDKINECNKSDEEYKEAAKARIVQGREMGLPEDHPDRDKEWVIVRFVYRCQVQPGLDAEIPALKALTSIDTYWIEDVKKLKAKNKR